MPIKPNIYIVHDRLAQLENFATETGKEIAALRVLLYQALKSLASVQIIARSPVQGPQGIPGISGVGVPGLTGREGAPGKDGVCVCQTTLDAVVPLRGEIAHMRSEFAALKRTCEDVIGMDQRVSDYMAWLRARREALKSS
jgi:hypothetical protein